MEETEGPDDDPTTAMNSPESVASEVRRNNRQARITGGNFVSDDRDKERE